MAVGRVNYVSWFFRVLGWDGIMPIGVFLIPNVIKLMFPNNSAAFVAMLFCLPLAVFSIRVQIGSNHIATNHCVIEVRRSQFCFFWFGLFFLFLIDATLMITQAMPKGAQVAGKSEWILWTILISIYLTSMTIAMYPGRVNSQDDTPSLEETFDAQEM